MSEFDAKDHWEALFDKNYLRWFHLNNKPALCEIEKIERSVEMTMKGGRKTRKPVIHLKVIKGDVETLLPLVMNRTNMCSIAEIHGLKPSKWIGKRVVLYPDTTQMYDQDKRQNTEVGCIRIRAEKGTT